MTHPIDTLTSETIESAPPMVTEYDVLRALVRPLLPELADAVARIMQGDDPAEVQEDAEERIDAIVRRAARRLAVLNERNRRETPANRQRRQV